MAVKIRMRRLGAKKKPFYRIVVADSRRSRDGRFIEEIGFYNPVSEPKMFRVDADKAKEWIKNGAQTSDTVARLFKQYEVLTTEGTVASGIEEQKKERFVEIPEVEEEVEETVETEEEVAETEETEVEETEEVASDDAEESEEAEEVTEETEA